ncbi:hypothetical protein AYI70_g2970 [Smittium culicis]|uniref:Uncharacterized protein n=1 Tax=Smittium culicis TaxID=133412 RepID=A0A1R1Y5W0_9FUNG|nr:hypothetical protein AYI70_g2970 [Smittium culicis]
MNQEAISQILVNQEQFNELTEMIEEDFFRSPLTEKERKIAIHSCPRTSSMNYNPPPLNDSASTAVKKADTALYRIQVALDQATRPIDYFVHRRIQDNPGLDTSEDPEVMFARTMRALLSDVAATVTQTRLDNLHKGLELPGKPTQLVEPDTKPLMDQEALDALIVKKPTAKHQSVQPFRKRQQSSNKNSISCNTATAQSTNAATTAEANPSNRTSDRHRDPKQPPSRGTPCYVQIGMVQTNGQPMGSEHSREGIQNPLQEPPLSRSGIEVVRYENSAESRIFAGDDLDSGAAPISKGALRMKLRQKARKVLTDEVASLLAKKAIEEISAQGSRLLQPAINDPEKDWRPQTSLRPPQAQPTCGGAELHDGDPVVHLPHGPQKRLFGVSRPTGCIYAFSGIQTVSEVPTLSLEWSLFPVSGPTIRVITELVGFHQDSSPSLTMGQVPRNANLSIFGRPTNHGRIQRGVCENHTQDILQAPGAGIQDQRREIVYDPIPIYHTSGDGNKHPGNDAEGTDNQDPGPSTRGQQNSECWPDDIEISMRALLGKLKQCQSISYLAA